MTPPISCVAVSNACAMNCCFAPASIAGATGKSYKLTSADLGFKIRAYVKATNSVGPVEVATASTASVTSG